jgi:hypothetical protein
MAKIPLSSDYWMPAARVDRQSCRIISAEPPDEFPFPTKYYCRTDLHARKMFVRDPQSEVEVEIHKNIKTDLAQLLDPISPSHEEMIIGGKCVFRAIEHEVSRHYPIVNPDFPYLTIPRTYMYGQALQPGGKNGSGG